MLKKMTDILSPITEKKETEDFIELKTRMRKDKKCFMDKELFEKFHKILFLTYKECPKKREKIRAIIRNSIKEIEKVKQKPFK